MAIPVLTRDQNFNSTRPYAGEGDTSNAMSVEGTVHKTLASFAILLVAGVVGWFMPVLALPAILIGLVFGIILSFKRTPSAPLTLLYSALQGVALGGISGLLEPRFPGIVMQAVLATVAVFAVILVLFANGRLRATPRMTKIFLAATFGYLLFSLLNLGLMLTGVSDGMFGLHSEPVFGVPLGIPLGILATALASYSLVLDFEYIKQAVQNRMPSNYEWKAAFGLVATLVWLYVELLRLIAIFRN